MTERPWPWRMIVRGAFQDGWSNADQDEKNEVFQALKEAYATWVGHGCTMIATLDDELSMVGQPGARLWNFYSIWEIPEPGIVYDLLNLFRREEAGVIRLDKYFRLETVVGKPIVGIERAVGLSAATPTPA
jgi:hypothetical protein